MRTAIIKQILLSVFCAGFGWYLAAWWASISHRPFELSSFGFFPLLLPALALVYVGIQKITFRMLYFGLLVLHYILLAGWIFSLGHFFRASQVDHYLTVVIFIGYAISQVGAWYAFCHSNRKTQGT